MELLRKLPLATIEDEIMKKVIINCCIFLISNISLAQNTYQIETSDIDNFWTAYDSLEYAKTKLERTELKSKPF